MRLKLGRMNSAGAPRILAALLAMSVLTSACQGEGLSSGDSLGGASPLVLRELSQTSAGASPAVAALDYDALGAPTGTAAIHARVFAHNPLDVPSSEALEAIDNAPAIVSFIAEHALTMNDRIWAVRMMGDYSSESGRLMLLDWVQGETTYSGLRCASVRSMRAFNLVTDTEVRDAVLSASTGEDACSREAALELIGD